MWTRPAITSAVLGCLCFSGTVQADEVIDPRGNILYGKIAGFTAEGVVFHQLCGDEAQTFAWDGVMEARFSDDCGAAKSYRGGGDPECRMVQDPRVVMTFSVEPENVPLVNGQPAPLPYGTATEVLGIADGKMRYRDVCTGQVKTVETMDMVVRRGGSYCASDCE